MRQSTPHSFRFYRVRFVVAVVAAAIALLSVLRLFAQETLRVGDFSASTAAVNVESAELGDTLTYTLVAKNTSGTAAPYVFARQLLTEGQTFDSAVVESIVDATQFSFVQSASGITWTGSISPSGMVTLSLRTTIDSDFAGATVDNIFEIASGFVSVEKPTTVRIAGRGLLFLPVVFKSLNAPTLNPITGAEDGSYTVSWTNNNSGVSGIQYVLEESTSSTFASATQVYSGANTSFNVTGKDGGTYFYRVRAQLNTVFSPWSNVQSAAVSAFEADATSLTVGQCTTLRWDFAGIKSFRVKLGKGYDFVGKNGTDTATVCPAVTTTYVAEVTNNDNSVNTYELTINVTGTGCGNGKSDPYINKLQSNKSSINGTETIELSWNAQCANRIELLIDTDNNGTIDQIIPVTGEETRNFTISKTTKYSLKVFRANSTGSSTFITGSVVVVRN